MKASQQHEAITAAYGRKQVVQIQRRVIERRWRGVNVQSSRCALGLEQCDLPLYGSAGETSRAANPCDGSLLPLGAGQCESPVSVPADAVGLQRHDHMAVDRPGIEASKPMKVNDMTSEQASAQIALLKQDDIEGALGEVQRERQVRERCYPRWVEEGKMSRIDAKDRMARQIIAEELLTLLLTAAPAS